CRHVAVYRPEVALPVHQHVTHRERLCHAHDRVVHRGIAVRMVLTDDVADDTRRLLVWLVVVVAELTHRMQHTAMHGLEPVPDIGQRPADYHAHRVVEIRLLHLVFETYRQYLLRNFSHKYSQNRSDPVQ